MATHSMAGNDITTAPAVPEKALGDVTIVEDAKPNVVQLKSANDGTSLLRSVSVFRHAILICALAGFTAITDGYQLKMSSNIVANKGFIQQFAPDGKVLDPTHVGTWGGVFSAGQVVGQFAIHWAGDFLGRKNAIYVCMFVLAISVTVESVSTMWWHYTLGKSFSGFGIGAIQSSLPVYINEHAPSQLRGGSVVAYSLWFGIGQLLASISLQARTVVAPLDWKTPIYTQFGMVAVSTVIFVFLPESPWWLISKGRIDRARSIMTRINSRIEGYDVDTEVAIIAETIRVQEEARLADKQTGLLDVLRGLNGKRFLIGSYPKVLQQFVGLAIFNSYSAYFFSLAGNSDPFVVTSILAGVNCVAYVLEVLLIDRLGRRFMTLIGFTGVCSGMTLIAIIGCLDYASAPLGKALVFGGVFASFFNSFQSSSGYAYLTEIPEQRLKAKSAGWGLAYCNLYAIVFNFTVPLMLKVWQVKAAFFFVALGVPGTVLAFFIMPETARRNPAEIHELFVEHVPLRKWKGYKTAVQCDLETRLEQ